MYQYSKRLPVHSNYALICIYLRYPLCLYITFTYADLFAYLRYLLTMFTISLYMLIFMHIKDSLYVYNTFIHADFKKKECEMKTAHFMP